MSEATVDLSQIHINLLGPFSFEAVNGQVRFPTRSAERLVAYLLLKRGRPVPRKTLAGTLWPDSDDVRAARNLNTTLWRVRSTLAKGTIMNFRIQSDSAQISASATAAEIDVIKFQDLTASILKLPAGDRLPAMTYAERLYAGDLLEGFDDDWVIPERTATRTRYISLLVRLIDACLTSRDFAQGIVYAGKLIAVDPLNEEGHRAMMLLSFMSGNRSGALAHYRRLKELLHAELGVEPSQESIDLWSHIRSGTSYAEIPRQFVMVER